IAEIPVKRVPAVRATEIKIAPAISVHIARRDTRTVQENLVCEMPRFGQAVREENSRRAGRQDCEADLARMPDLQRRAPITGPRLPVQSECEVVFAGDD